jgi:hypothetical protein
MASEHEHDQTEHHRVRIPTTREAELEQQLAETREELRIALAQRQNYRADATQARALLEQVLDVYDWPPRGPSGGVHPLLSPPSVEHCIAKIRAFLAQHKEQSNE